MIKFSMEVAKLTMVRSNKEKESELRKQEDFH